MERVLEVEGPDGQIKEIKLEGDSPEVKDIDFDLDVKQHTVEVPVIKGEAEVQKPGVDVTVVKPEVDLKRHSKSRSRSSSSSSSSSSDDEDKKDKDKDKKKKKKDKKEKKEKKEKKGGFFGLFGRKSRSPSPKKETKDKKKDKKDKKKRGSKESTPDRRSTSREGSVEVQAKVPEVEEEVHFPKERESTGFEITLPHLKLPSLQGAVHPEGEAEFDDVNLESPKGSLEREHKVKAQAPDPNVVIVTGEIVTEEKDKKPKDSTLEGKKKKGFFSLGRGDKKDKKRKSSVDSSKSSGSRPSLNVEVEGDLPEVPEVKVDTDVKLKDRKRKSSASSQSDDEKEKKHKAGFGIHLPKFGGKGSVDGEADVKGPKEAYVVEDLESIEVKAPKVKAEKQRRVSTSSQNSDTDTDKEKKHKGFDIHLPKVHLPKFGGKGSVDGDVDVDVEGPKGEVELEAPEVEIKAPKRKSSTSSQTSDTDTEKKHKAGFDIHLPKVKLPKFGGKGSVEGDVDVDVKGPKESYVVEDLESVEVKGPKVKAERKRDTSTSSQTSDTDTDKEKKHRGFDIHLPKVSLPKFKKKGSVEGDIDVDVDRPEVDIEVDTPEVKAHKRKSSTSSQTSDTDTDKEKKHKAGFDIHLPKVKLPKFGGKGSVEGDVDGPKEGYVVEDLEAVEVKAPKVKVEKKRNSSTSSQPSDTDTDKEKHKGFDIHFPKVHLPKFGGKGSVDGEVDVEADKPEAEIDVPEVEIERKRKSSTSSQTSDSDTDKQKKSRSLDIRLPKVKLPKFGGKGSVDGDVDVKGPKESFVVEDLESVEVKKPKIKRKSSTSSQTSDTEKPKLEVELEGPNLSVESKSSTLEKKSPRTKKKLFGGFHFGGKKTREIKRKSSVSSASDDEKSPKGPKEGFVVEDLVTVEGKSGKKKKKGKDIDVDVEAPSISGESKGSSLDRKSPKKKWGFSLGRKKKGSEESTPEPKRKGSTSSQTSDGEKKHKAGFDISIPKVKLPKFGGEGSVEGDVDGPKEGYVVEDLEAVEVRAPKVKVEKQRRGSTSSQTSDTDTDKEKKHKAGFDIHLPKVHLPKFGGKGSVDGEVDVEVDKPEVEIEGPEVEVERHRKSSTSSQTSDDEKRRKVFDIHLPKVHLPKFGGKGSVDGDVDVDVKGPKEGYVVEDLETVEVKAPKVKVEKQRRGSTSSQTSDTDTDKEKKHKAGFDIHLPKVHLPKFGGKGSVDGEVDVDVKGPKEGYVVEDLEAVEVKAPKVRKSSTSSQTSDTDTDKDKHKAGFDIHLPKVKLPKFGGKGGVDGDFDIEVGKPEVEVETPEVEIERKRKSSTSSQTSEDEKKRKGFDIHLPKFSLPKFKGKGSVEGDVNGPKEGYVVEDLEAVEVKKPKVKRKGSTSSDDKGKVDLELEGRSASVDGSLDGKSPKKKWGFSLGRKKKGSKESTPEAKRKDSTSSETSDTDKDKEKKHKAGFGIHLPKFGGKGKGEGHVVEDLEAVEVKVPKVKDADKNKGKVEVDVDVPSVNGSLDRKSPKKKWGFSLGRKKKGSEEGTPEPKRKGSTSSQTSDDGKKHKAGFDISLPKVKLPKFGGKGSIDGEVDVDVKGPKESYVVEDLETVEVKAPKVKVEKQRRGSTSSQTSDTDTDKEKKHKGFDIHLPKVHLPKFGGKGSVDGDVNVDKPEVVFEGPEVEVERQRKSSTSSQTSGDEKKRKGFDIHLPKVHLPKFGGKDSVDGDLDVDEKGPKEGYVVEDLETVEVKAPKVKVEKQRRGSTSSQTSDTDTDKEKKHKFGIHLPEVDLHLPKLRASATHKSETDEEEKEKPKRKFSTSSQTSEDEKKQKAGFDIHLPKVKLPKFGGKGSVEGEVDVDVKGPKEAYVVEDLESVEDKKPKVKRKSSTSSDDKGKVDLELEGPSVGVDGSFDGKSPKKKWGFSLGRKKEGEKTPELKRKTSTSSQTSDTDTDQEKKHKAGFGIHLPKFGGKGSISGEVDVDGPKEGYVVKDLESVEVKAPKSPKEKSPRKKFGFGFKGRTKSSSESHTDTDVAEPEIGAVEYKADLDLDLKKPEGEIEIGTAEKPKEQKVDDVINVGAEDFMVQDFVVVEEKDKKGKPEKKHIDVQIGKKKKKKKGTSSESESTEPSSPEVVKIKGPELEVSASTPDERDRKSKSLGRRFKELFGTSQVIDLKYLL